MLPLIRRRTRIPHQTSLPPPIKSRSRRRITAAIRHDATHHDLLHVLPPQYPLQPGIDKRIVGILRHDL